MTGTSPSPSSAAARAETRPPGFVVVADSDDVRVALFQEALSRLGLAAATVIGYQAIASGQVRLEEAILRDCIVRIDSPGRGFQTCLALLRAGADAARAEGSPCIGPEQLARLAPDKGRILFPRQWYLGFVEVLNRMARCGAGRGDVRFVSDPHDISILFDKSACHRRLDEAGIPVPPSLREVGSFEELRFRMRQQGQPRVFVKLRHGSAASGVAAYECGPHGEQAWTTCEIVRAGGRIELYNSRRIRRCTAPADLAGLLDTLCAHGVHVEAWVPKASVDGCVCDLRVLAIGGRPCHTVLRMSKTPLTNLHLLNQRSDPQPLRRRMSDEAWQSLLDTCRRTAATFPRSLHVGIDVAVQCGLRRHAVLEVNAFGDLLKGVVHEGCDTYTAELACLLGGGG